MKKILIILMAVVLLAGCSSTISNQESKDTQSVEDQQSHYAKTQPIPVFDYSLDRDVLIQLYKAKNEARNTWSVIASQGTGDVIFSCPSIGYGIPGDTQLTNPLMLNRQYQSNWGTAIDGVIEQPEPNGIFSSKNTDATYVLCVQPDGKVTPVYTEQKVDVYPFEVKIQGKQVVQVSTNSSVELDLGKAKPGPSTNP